MNPRRPAAWALDWTATGRTSLDWAGTPVGIAVITAVVTAVLTAVAGQAITWRSRRRTGRDQRRDQLVAAAVEVVAAAATLRTALELHAELYLSRRTRIETAGMAAVDWWAGDARHGPPAGLARAARTVLRWRRESQAVAAAISGPQTLLHGALGRWSVLADPRDLHYGLAVSDAVEKLARVHGRSARRRKDAAQALDRAGIRLIAAARASGGAPPRRRGERRAGRRILRNTAPTT